MSYNWPLYVKLCFGAVQLTSENKGGVGGRLGYSVWEEFALGA